MGLRLLSLSASSFITHGRDRCALFRRGYTDYTAIRETTLRMRRATSQLIHDVVLLLLDSSMTVLRCWIMRRNGNRAYETNTENYSAKQRSIHLAPCDAFLDPCILIVPSQLEMGSTIPDLGAFSASLSTTSNGYCASERFVSLYNVCKQYVLSSQRNGGFRYFLSHCSSHTSHSLP